MKKTNNNSLYEMMNFIKEGVYPEIVETKYTPKPDETTNVFVRGDRAVLSISIQGEIESPYGVEIPVECDSDVKKRTLPYAKALAFIVNEGFILDNFESYQMVLRKENNPNSKSLKLNGQYTEYWNKNVEEVLV